MRFDTALNHRDRARSRFDQDFFFIKTMSSAEFSEKVIEIKKSLAKCPRWVKSWLDGYIAAKRATAARDLVFFYTMPDGRKFSAHSNRDDYYGKHGIGPREVYEQAIESGHYWVNGDKLVAYYVSNCH